MDPVSAVGLAAAMAQFIGIAIKATSLCIQIRDSADSATSANQELETLMREVKQSRKELSSTLARGAPRRIIDLANKCEQMADELVKLLEHVRGAGENISTAKKVYRALKERKTVEKIQNSLKEKETLLQSLLVQDIWHRFDLQHADQSKQFSRLDSQTQDIIKELTKLYSNANDHTRGLTRNLASVAAQVNAKLDKSDIKAQTRHEKTMLSVTKASERVERSAREFSETSERRRHKDAFLKTLFFPEMNERQANIKDAAPGTLEWLFASLEPLDPVSGDDNANTTDVKWDDFGEWLCNHSSVFWICGKLGSGKSTLMAHIVDDQRTQAGLEVWSRGHQVHTFSFFFWRPGTSLQKSIIGLLRSLLYQILLVKPNIIPHLMEVLSSHTRRLLPAWTEKNLTLAVVKAIEIASETQFCIFIDGLDEFVGDYDELVDLIFKLQDLRNIKVCVSSRPEAFLTRRLANCKQLHLQDLNCPDITRYIEQKLSNNIINDGCLSSNIRSEIVHQAEGVFLWAALVTQDIIQGAKSGDDEELLLKRIERTPRAIDDIFGMMLENIDELHKDSLAFYVKVADLWDFLLLSFPLEDNLYDQIDSNAVEYMTSVSIITSARITTPILFKDTFMQSCQQTEIQIRIRSAGLLETSPSGTGPRSASQKSKSNWFMQSEPNWSDSAHGVLPDVHRNLAVSLAPYPHALEYELQNLSWVHRSAYDFAHDSRNIDKFKIPSPSFVDVLLKLIEGGLKYLTIAPSCQTAEPEWLDVFPHGYLRAASISMTSQRLKYQLICLSLLWKHDSSIALKATDRLLHIVCQLDPRELAHLDHGKLVVLPADYAFWRMCGMVSYWGYLRYRIRKVPPNLYTTLLRSAFTASKGDAEFELALELLDLLLERFSSQGRIAGCSGNSIVFIRREARVDTPGSSYSYVQHEQHVRTQYSFTMEMEMFAVAFTRFLNHYCYPRAPPSKNLLRRILSSMSEVSACTDLYIGIASHGRLSLQLSACLFEKYAMGGFDGDDTAHTNGLRIVCQPWYKAKELSEFFPLPQVVKALELREVGRFIILTPRAETTAIILQKLSFEYENFGDRWKTHISTKRKDLYEFVQMIIDYVWTNEQRMSSTDQLFMLACIRLDLRGLLQSIWRDAENPNPTYGWKFNSFLKDDGTDKEWITDEVDAEASDWTTDQGDSIDGD